MRGRDRSMGSVATLFEGEEGLVLPVLEQSWIAESKNTNLLNIFVTKKHEDSHVELSTISTGLSFLIVTTITKTTTKTRTTIFISS